MSFANYCHERAKRDLSMRNTVVVLPSGDWDYETAMGIILTANDPCRFMTLALIRAREDYIDETEGRNIVIDPMDPLTEVEVLYLEDILIEPTEESLAARMARIGGRQGAERWLGAPGGALGLGREARLAIESRCPPR